MPLLLVATEMRLLSPEVELSLVTFIWLGLLFSGPSFDSWACSSPRQLLRCCDWVVLGGTATTKAWPEIGGPILAMGLCGSDGMEKVGLRLSPDRTKLPLLERIQKQLTYTVRMVPRIELG